MMHNAQKVGESAENDHVIWRLRKKYQSSRRSFTFLYRPTLNWWSASL